MPILIPARPRPIRPSRMLTSGAWTIVGAATLLLAAVALADAVGYAGVVDLRSETGAVVAEHHHDWSRSTEGARFKMISTTKDPFTADNTYSYLRLLDKASGREIFRKPVPALTHLWISPDSRYVVGLSSIKLWNPYQIVVFSRSGVRIFERAVTAASWPGVFESVTNAVFWYEEPSPTIRLEEKQGAVTLSIEDTQGTLRPFRFRASE
jgi:hypothetical protein